jgi:hypothetical protein
MGTFPQRFTRLRRLFLQSISAARWLLHRVDYMLPACQPISMVRNSKLLGLVPFNLFYSDVPQFWWKSRRQDPSGMYLFVRYGQCKANFAIGSDLR